MEASWAAGLGAGEAGGVRSHQEPVRQEAGAAGRGYSVQDGEPLRKVTNPVME